MPLIIDFVLAQQPWRIFCLAEQQETISAEIYLYSGGKMLIGS